MASKNSSSEERAFQPPASSAWYERPIIPARVPKPLGFRVDPPDGFTWLVLAGSSFGMGVALFYVLNGNGRTPGLLSPLVTFGVLLAAGRLWRRIKNGRSDLERDRMAFLDGYQWNTWFTSVTIFRDGREVGRDNGVVWFEDGSLMFSGVRCSFAISGEDVRLSTARIGWRSAWMADFSPACLILRHPSDIILVRFRPAQSKTADEIFISKLNSFRKMRNQKGTYRQYPPLERPQTSV